MKTANDCCIAILDLLFKIHQWEEGIIPQETRYAIYPIRYSTEFGTVLCAFLRCFVIFIYYLRQSEKVQLQGHNIMATLLYKQGPFCQEIFGPFLGTVFGHRFWSARRRNKNDSKNGATPPPEGPIWRRFTAPFSKSFFGSPSEIRTTLIKIM